MTEAQRKVISDLEALIKAHREHVVDWFDERFPDSRHIPHPDRRPAKEGK